MHLSNSARAGRQEVSDSRAYQQGLRAAAVFVSCGAVFQATTPFLLEAVRSLGCVKEGMQQRGYRLYSAQSLPGLSPQESCRCTGWPPGGGSRPCLL